MKFPPLVDYCQYFRGLRTIGSLTEKTRDLQDFSLNKSNNCRRLVNLNKKSSLGKIGTSLKNLLSDKAISTWRLLSETDYFLSNAGLISGYENQMRELRKKMSMSGSAFKEKIIKEVHSELVDLRKELRLMGYDVSLGRHRLIFDGFRHDDSLRKGFRRIVLFILDDFFLWQTGEANHIELAQMLELQIIKQIQTTGKKINIKEKHYLWYLRTKQELILSGSDSEAKESYEKLKAYGEASGLLFLSRLKKLN